MKAFEFYEQKAPQYNSDINKEFYEQIAEKLLSQISPKISVKSVLEIGAGTGFATAKIQSFYPNAKVIGIEPSPAMLNKARSKFPNVKWSNVSLSNFEINTDYDLVVSSMAAHWLTEDEWQKLFFLSEKSILALVLPTTTSINNKNNIIGKELKKLLFKLKAKPEWLKQARFHPTLSPEWRGSLTFLDEKNALNSDFQIEEEFKTKKELVETLNTRGVFLALFGEKTQEAKKLFESTIYHLPSTIYHFIWSFKLIVTSPEDKL